jgi:glycosyltransferase involved in cell wall biosynthesis
MAQGCTIIATDCGGPAEILQKSAAGDTSRTAKYGFLVPTADGAAISKALAELISDPAKLDSYKSLARERSEDYRFSEAIVVYIDSYVN